MVNNFYKNRNLGLVIEASVGTGKLLLCSSDLAESFDSRPVARPLRYSLLKYMESAAFDPKDKIPFDRMKKVI